MSLAMVACLVAGAVVAAWPARRRRLVVDSGPARGSSWRQSRLRWAWASASRRPRRAVAFAVGVAAGVGFVVGGPVAAVVVTVYGALAGRAVLRRAARRREAASRAAAIDGLAGLAADLRAGLPPRADAGSLSGSFSGAPSSASGRLGRLVSSVWRLAEKTGAPAADLVERIEADARAADRAAASAAAQAAGAQATALLLAALPIGGIALGFAIGADPVAVLLHTPLGAACAVGAVVLQGGGLLWADRLTEVAR
jgi:tight adherence protein B